MREKADINHKLVKKYRQKFVNIYCWAIILVFLISLGYFIFSTINNPVLFTFKHFFRYLSPSIINGLCYIILRYLIREHKDCANGFYIGVFLFSIYSFELLFPYHMINMTAPVLLILSTIFMLDKKLIKKEVIIVIATNVLFVALLYFLCHYNFFDLMVSFLFSAMSLIFTEYICCIVINYINDFLDENIKILKRQEILQQNINKAINDLKIEPMTKLFNKKAMQEAMDVKINNFNTRGTKAFLAILDLDFFKKVNDTYGHDVGDKVLIELADFLKKKLDKKANAFRFGGEEFVIIFDKYSESEVYQILEDIRISFSQKKFKYMDNKNLTLSVGFTQIQKDDTKDTFLKRADEALYKSKENGRNQVNKN